MDNDIDKDRWYSFREAKVLLGVCWRTLWNWQRSGHLRPGAVRVCTLKKNRRYSILGSEICRLRGDVLDAKQLEIPSAAEMAKRMKVADETLKRLGIKV